MDSDLSPDGNLTLDGNAAAGVLAEVFVSECTTAMTRCDACGAVEMVGALKAYVQAPGTVLRCRHCESVLLRVVRGAGSCWVDVRGLTWMQFKVATPGRSSGADAV